MPTEHAWLRDLAGRFIAFEGPDGSGKTTQFRRFVAACRDAGVSVCEVREPGGTGVGERIRDILLDRAHGDITPRCEMMLYMASRAQLVEACIRPALRRGELVAADRFVASTYAYQGAGGGVPEGDIRAVADAALSGCAPDATIVFDVDEATAASRLSPLLDRVEAKDKEFHRRVREGYLALARSDPARYRVIDAARGEEQVWYALLTALRSRFTA